MPATAVRATRSLARRTIRWGTRACAGTRSASRCSISRSSSSMSLMSDLLSERFQAPRNERLHGSWATVQELGHPLLGEVLVEAEHDRRPLPRREPLERRPEIVPRVQVDRTGLRTNGRPLPRQIGPLHPLPAELGVRQVHHGAPEVRGEGGRVAEMDQPAGQPDEGVLNHVLGQGTVAGQQVRQANGIVRVANVQLAQAAALDLLSVLHLRLHHGDVHGTKDALAPPGGSDEASSPATVMSTSIERLMSKRKPRPARRWRLVLRFAVGALVAFAVVGAGLSVLLSRRVLDRDRRAAAEHAQFVVDSVLADHLTAKDLSAPVKPDRYAQLLGFARTQVLQPPLVLVTVWRSDGTVLFSSIRSFVGKKFVPASDLRAAFVGDISRSAVVYNLDKGKLFVPRLPEQVLDTFVPLASRTGHGSSSPSVVVEIYTDYASVIATA